uniref:Phytanoyl-CoA dioxygenase n=1 Tax=Bionectria ochroleuca TaxID=29856 RepID=A0A8H7K9U3_BIOOC
MAVPSLVTIDSSEPLEKMYEIVARDGGVIVSNFLTPELLKEAMDGINREFAARKKIFEGNTSHSELGADFFPEGTQRVYGLLGKMPTFISGVLRLKVWQGIMDKFLSDERSTITGDKYLPLKSGYMLATTAGLRLEPGAKPQPLHRDEIKFQSNPDPNNPLFTPMIGCLIAGSRCTKKNGATLVIPGSHLWPSNRFPKIEEVTYAEMEPGSALFTLGSTYHAAGENKCERGEVDSVRTLFACFGQRDYFRQDQDEVHSTPISVIRSLPDDILRLAGFYKSVGGVGYVADHQDPAEFLHVDECGSGRMGTKIQQAATTI